MKSDKIILLELLKESLDWFSIGRIKKGLETLEKAKGLAEKLVEED